MVSSVSPRVNERPPTTTRRLSRTLDALTVTYALILELTTHWPYDPAGYVRFMLRTERPPSDKTLHLVAYSMLSALLWWCVRLRGTPARRTTAIVLVVVAAWAAIDEVTQPLCYRAAEPLDWVYDVIGGAIGCMVALILDRSFAADRSP